MGSIEAEGLLRLMGSQHLQNRGDIDDLKKGQAELREDMTTLTGEINGIGKTLKFIGWLLLAFMSGMGIWFASLEARGKISDNKPPAVVSSTHNPPQDAEIPRNP